jgi:uncharacterized membrane protein
VRFPRMTMRRWIVVVVVVAVVVIGPMIGGGVTLIRQRRDYFLTLAHSHQNEVAASMTRVTALKARLGNKSEMSSEVGQLYRDYERMRDRTDHHAAMAHKYEHAARYPWLPVEPDPPEPD